LEGTINESRYFTNQQSPIVIHQSTVKVISARTSCLQPTGFRPNHNRVYRPQQPIHVTEQASWRISRSVLDQSTLTKRIAAVEPTTFQPLELLTAHLLTAQPLTAQPLTAHLSDRTILSIRKSAMGKTLTTDIISTWRHFIPALAISPLPFRHAVIKGKNPA